MLVGATVPPYPGPDVTAWLHNASAFLRDEEGGYESHFFAALEVDARGVEMHRPVTDALATLGGNWWTFHVDDGASELTSVNRLRRICVGRNLIVERAFCADYTHVLFLDADLTPPPDALRRLLELPDHPVVGGHVPEYCLDGPPVDVLPGADVRAHWNTAGFLLVRRDVLDRVQWGHAGPSGVTDDPWFQDRVREAFGTETWVRHDVVARHDPLVPLEARGYDRRYQRV